MEGQYDIDLDPVSFITVGTVGPPGERTFYLQAAQGSNVVSLVIEKEQAVALATGVEQLLEQVREKTEVAESDLEPEDVDLALLTPVEPAFRVAQMGIGVDEDRGHVVLIAEEIGEEGEGRRARFTASYGQMAALSDHAVEVAEQGRPRCPLCGEPMESEGHFCIRTNGHQKGPGAS